MSFYAVQLSQLKAHGLNLLFVEQLFSLFFSSLGVLIVQLINIFNQKVILILGPKDDAENVARKIIKANKKRTKIRYVFYEIDGKID